MSPESKFEIINLKNWQEAIGVYKGTSPRDNPILRIKGEDLEINASNFPLNERLIKQFSDLFLDDLVGIIRTDSFDQPFLVRIIRRAKIEK